MSGASRNKGKVGERELATILSEITGWPVRRRVRQHPGDSDLEGLSGWSIEVKRHARVTPGLVATWWEQAHRQAVASYCKAVLFYRADRGHWRAVWAPIGGSDYLDTIEADPSLWWRMAGRCCATGAAVSAANPGRGGPHPRLQQRPVAEPRRRH